MRKGRSVTLSLLFNGKGLMAGAGAALTTPMGLVLLWGTWAFLFASLAILRNTVEVDYEGFLDAGRHFWLKDPQQPVYQGSGWYNPIWVAALLGPLGVLPDRALAIQLWRLAEVLLLFAGAFLWLRTSPLSQRLLWSALSIVFLPAWQGVEYGNVMGFMVLGYSLIGWGLDSGKGWPLAAGAVLITAKPHFAALPLLTLFGHLLAARRWRELSAILGALVAIACAPYLWYPNWISEWITAIVTAPPGMAHAPTNLFQIAYNQAGLGVALVLGSAVFLAALSLGMKLLRSPLPRPHALAVLIVLGLLTSPRVVYIYDLTLLLPLLWTLVERPATTGLALVVFLFPLALAFVGGEAWAMLYPVGAVACLLAGQRWLAPQLEPDSDRLNAIPEPKQGRLPM